MVARAMVVKLHLGMFMVSTTQAECGDGAKAPQDGLEHDRGKQDDGAGPSSHHRIVSVIPPAACRLVESTPKIAQFAPVGAPFCHRRGLQAPGDEAQVLYWKSGG